MRTGMDRLIKTNGGFGTRYPDIPWIFPAAINPLVEHRGIRK